MPRPRNQRPEFKLTRVKDKRYPNGYRPEWYITYTETGRTKYVSTGTESQEEAKRQLEEFKEEFLTVDKESLTVNIIIDEYLKYKKQKYMQTNSPARNYKSLEFKLTSPREYFGHLFASQVTRRMGRDYDLWRRKVHAEKHKLKKNYKMISNATIRMEGAILNAALNHAFKEDWITRQIVLELPQDAPSRDRRLTSEEKKRLIAHCQANHIKLFIMLALTTAQRKTAILELKWSQVDMSTRTINFTPKGHYVTNKRRSFVPINDLLYSCLKEALVTNETDYVIEYNGSRVKEVLNGFKKTCERANIKGVSPHTLRHTAACDMAARGVSLQEIAAVLGDGIRTVERHYLKYNPSYLSNAVNTLNVL